MPYTSTVGNNPTIISTSTITHSGCIRRHAPTVGNRGTTTNSPTVGNRGTTTTSHNAADY